MNNKTKFLWIYAIVLFTMAFILIFFSAVNQYRMNKNIDSYKEHLNKQTGLFQGIEEGISTLVSENENLKKQLKELEEKNNDLENKNKITNEKLEQLNAQVSEIGRTVDNLLNAKESFDKKDYKQAALSLEQINPNLLGEKSRELYNHMQEVSFEKAARIFYNEGYKLYVSGQYEQAILSFQKSVQFKNDQYFSDDAMYYLGDSYLKINNVEEAEKTFNQFKELYPTSQFISLVQEKLDMIRQDKG